MDNWVPIKKKMANWADLPHDVLLRISDFYSSPDYILRMQYACKSWQTILKESKPRELPWLMMLPNNKEEEEEEADARDFFSLSKKKIHTIPLPELRGKRCCGSFQNGWLMTADDKLDICLFHPWSKKKFDLPHPCTFKYENYKQGLHIRKAAISDDSKVLVIVYEVGLLAFCRIGDDAYTEIELGLDALMDDVIYHMGKFYALSVRAAIYLLHIEEGRHPHGEKLTAKLDPGCGSFLGYLVPDILTHNMFVIIRDKKWIQRTNEESLLQQTCNFDVYWVTLEDGAHDRMLKQFTRLKSLGDRVLFLGYNSPIIVIASQFPGFKGNHIYFADNYPNIYCWSPSGCCDLGVYSLEDGKVEQLFADRFHSTFSPPLWIATPPYSSS